MSLSASAAAIIDRAVKQTGLDQFDSRSFEEGLEILMGDLDRSPILSPMGRTILEGMFVNLLSNRLRIEDYARKNPALLAKPVAKPVVVLGMPRTGTTLASYLLGADLKRRSLLKWELWDSVPPPTLETLRTDPRCLARKAADEARAAKGAGGAEAIHFEPADGPSECTFLVGGDFKSSFLEGMHRVPAYSEWLMGVDFASAYRYHTLTLQVLQSQAPGTWNLKMPSHALFIGALLDAYPDARIVWTHRDPYKTTGSLCSLIDTSYSGFATEPAREHITKIYPRQLQAHVDRMMDAVDAGRLHSGNLFNLYYNDLVSDPIGQMKQLYAWLGDEFTPEAEGGMQGWLTDNPQNKFGKHAYGLEKYGLSKEQLKPRFERYLSRYNVASEG